MTHTGTMNHHDFTPYLFTLQGVVVPSANGTFSLRVKRGGGSGNVAVRAGTLEATSM